MQPATIDPTLDLRTRYPCHYGWVDSGIVEYEESNPRPSDLGSNALTTGPHGPKMNCAKLQSRFTCYQAMNKASNR